MAQAAFVYADALSRHVLRPDHPMRPVRLRRTYELLRSYGAFDGSASRLVSPRTAAEAEVARVHTPEYIAAVRSLSSGRGSVSPERYGFSDLGDNPVYPGMYEAALLSSGATLLAAEMVGSGQVNAAFSIAGGLHHAAPARASGFCIFNDPALAVHYFLAQGQRVAYVDVDAHHGDGVQNIFYRDNRVLTISIHESGHYLFPGTGFTTESGAGPGEGYSVNIPLYPYTEDELYLWAFRQAAMPLLEAFAPDILVTQLGIDSYHSDPLTHLQLTSRGYVAVIRELARLNLPWLALGGGGYDLEAVARCWTLAYGVMLGIEWPDRIPDSRSSQYAQPVLRDSLVLNIPGKIRQDAQRYAAEEVARLRENLLPFHRTANDRADGA